MQLIDTISELQTFRQSLPSTTIVGFVPTMGALHAGHEALLQRARDENDITIASIFVNPRQFNSGSDFSHYPKTPERDYAVLEETGTDVCFMPKAEMIYKDQNAFTLSENHFSHVLEGQFRPGHFDGVLTVVLKLFNLVKPHRAYFGEKDYQQLLLIQRMIDAFFMDIHLVPCSTVREEGNLPLSSRNQRLNASEHLLAQQCAAIFHQQLSDEDTINQFKQLGVTLDYIETYENRRFIAFQIGNIRLIDNYSLHE